MTTRFRSSLNTAVPGGLRALATSRTLHTHLGVLGLYLVLTLYVLAQVLPHVGSAIPGTRLATTDGWQLTWQMWWTVRALAQGENPFVTTMIFYPDGTSLYLHPLNLPAIVLTLPVQLVFGPAAAFNAAVVLGFVLTGYATFLLVADRTDATAGLACLIGALVTFSPFHLAKLWDAHIDWVNIQWVPFYVLFLLRALPDAPGAHARWRDPLLAALFLVLAALTSWYLGLYCLIFTALLAAARLPDALRRGHWRADLRAYALVGGLTGVLLLPFLVPTILEYRAGFQRGGGGWDRLVIAHSADLLDIFFPGFLHPLWGRLAQDMHDLMRYGIWSWTITPGLGVLALALAGGWLRWRQARRWVLVALALLVLALGPRLVVAGINTGVPLPYELLAVIPGVSTARRPNHLVVMMFPLLALLAACGVQALWQRGRRGRWAAGGLAALAVLECLVLPLPVAHFGVSPTYAELRSTPGAVLELPLGHRSAGPMKSQMLHERPTVTGYLSRTPDVPPFLARVPWLRELWEMQPRPPDIIPARPDDTRQALHAYGIRTIVAHPQHPELLPGQGAALLALLDQRLPDIAPEQAAPGLLFYEVPPVAAPRPLAYLGEGWHRREHEEGRIWRWMGAHATVRLVNPFAQPRPVTLALTAESYQHARPLTLHLNAAPLGTFEMGRAARTLHVRLLLPPGEHTLHLRSEADAEPSDEQRALSLSFSRIELVSTTP